MCYCIEIMTSYKYESRQPRSEDISLTPENEALHQQLVSGLEVALSADTALTVEVTDTSERSGQYKLPRERYLARVAFLKIKGLGETGSDSEALASFQVAVELNTHLLDADVATEKSSKSIRSLGYAWRDGVKATLLDRDYSNITSWTSRFQPNAENVFYFTGSKSGVFYFTGSKRGFAVAEAPDDDIVSQAYGIRQGINSGASIAKDGQGRLDSFRIISVILNEGAVDTTTTESFLGTIAQSETLKLLPNGSPAHDKSRQYMDGLLKTAVETPKFRDVFASKQY